MTSTAHQNGVARIVSEHGALTKGFRKALLCALRCPGEDFPRVPRPDAFKINAAEREVIVWEIGCTSFVDRVLLDYGRLWGDLDCESWTLVLWDVRSDGAVRRDLQAAYFRALCADAQVEVLR